MNTRTKLLICGLCLLILTAVGWRRLVHGASQSQPLTPADVENSSTTEGLTVGASNVTLLDNVDPSQRVALPAAQSASSVCSVSVLAQDSLTPLGGASIQARDIQGKSHDLQADSNGVATLPALGVWWLAVAAPGHVRREFVGKIDVRELVVLLEPGGSIEVQVRSESGAPISGAEVALIPPLVGEPSEGLHGSLSLWLDKIESPKLSSLLGHVSRLRRGAKEDYEALNPDADGRSFEFGPHAHAFFGSHEALPSGGLHTTTDPDEPFSKLFHEPQVLARVYEAVPSDGWRTKTDAEGRALWSGLPPLQGYRVKWAGTGSVELSPRHEFKSFVYERGGWNSNSHPPVEDLTGVLDVRVGQTVAVDVVVFRDSMVHGRLDTFGTSLIAPSVVKLYHRTVHSSGEGPSLIDNQMESAAVPSMDGKFEFRGVKPGAKWISAHWSTGAGVIRFAKVDFDLAKGATHDVGMLSPQPGVDVVVRAVLTTPDGKELAPTEVFESGVQPEVVLNIDNFLRHEDSGAITEAVGVRLGQTVVLSGIPPVDTLLRAEFAADYPLRQTEQDTQIAEPKERRFVAGSAPEELVAFVVTRQVLHGIRIAWPGPGKPPRLEVNWRSTSNGTIRDTNVSPPHKLSADGIYEYKIILAEGEYELFVHAHTQSEPRDDHGWYWTGSMSVSSANTTTGPIELLPGSALSGRVLSKEGSPLAGELVNVVVPGWTTGSDELRSMYIVVTDAEGRYWISSLPPHGEFSVHLGSKKYVVPARTGPVGSTRSLDLRNPFDSQTQGFFKQRSRPR
jgi:hypothetical protein